MLLVMETVAPVVMVVVPHMEETANAKEAMEEQGIGEKPERVEQSTCKIPKYI